MEQFEKAIITLIILAMVFTFGYHAVANFIHHNYDAGAVNMLLALIVSAIGKSLKPKRNE